jgi:outer membrane immunogenic protein
MRALLSSFLLVCGASGGIAQAQSRPSVDWSGYYIGANLGAGIGNADLHAGVRPDTTYFNTGTDSDQVAAAGRGKPSLDSFTGGAVIGYNVQYGNILFGLEAGANAVGVDEAHSGSSTFLTDPNIQFTVTQTVKSDWIATLRPRIGWAQDNWLVYVTGGLAWTRLELDTFYGDNNAQAGSGLPGAHANGSTSSTKTGWTLGAGGEYALSSNWSLTGQYLFIDFGSVNTVAPLVPTPTLDEFSATIDGSADLSTSLIMVGATYRFGALP